MLSRAATTPGAFKELDAELNDFHAQSNEFLCTAYSPIRSRARFVGCEKCSINPALC